MGKQMKKSIKKIVPIVILVLLPFALFYKAAIGSSIITSGDLSGSDLLDLHYPFKAILHRTLPKGRLPLWEPNESLGFPILAEGQSGPLYPLNIITSFLPPALDLNLSIIITFILSAIFTYFYSRSLGLNRFSALISGMTFAFSAFFVARLKHLNMINVAAWVPFIFWMTRKLFQERKLRYALLTGIGFALQLLAGHPQMAFFSFFIFLIYYVFEAGLSISRTNAASSLPLTFIGFSMIAATAVGLSAVQLLPTLELSQFSERQEFTVQTATAYPFHPKNLITLIAPYYFGNPATGTYGEDIRITGVFWENVSYVGLLPLFLALWAMLRTLKTKPHAPFPLFFTALALLSLILMMGRALPLYKTIWYLLPGFNLFRFPTRFNLFLILSLALLAGWGANLLILKLTVLHKRPRFSKSEGARFTWPLKTLPTQILMTTFILIDLFVFATTYLGFMPMDKFLEEPEIVTRLKEESDHFRVYSLTQYGQSPYSALGWKKGVDAILAMRKSIPPNNNVLYNLDSFTDRAWFEGGLGLKRRHRLENFLLYENSDPLIIGKILGTFNVKYIVSFADAIGLEIEKVKEFDLGDQFASSIKLFENKQVIPRAIFVPEAEVLPNEDAVFERLKSLEFLPTKTVLLEKQPRQSPQQFSGALDTFHKENPVSITRYAETEVEVSADIKDHGFLVLSDMNYPGWKAQVDGHDQEVLQANYLIRALELEPGNHTIRFYFDPLSFKIGAVISAGTMLIICILIFASWTGKQIQELRSGKRK